MRISVLFVILGLVVAARAAFASEAKASKPNFILIYADDLGYGDLGCYGAEGYATPELDRMAEQGLRFTDFSTSSSICTPSRAGLLTGRYAQRWGHEGGVYWPYSADGMPGSEITIAETLQESGYETALVGKWHLGHRDEFHPVAQGFDLYYGIPFSNDMWHDPSSPLAEDAVFNAGFNREDFLNHKVKDRKTHRDNVPLMLGREVIEWPVDQSTLTKRYTEKALQFIESNKDKPFFLYFAHAMPHTPLFASERFAGKSERGIFGDVIEEMDWSTGEILKALQEHGLDRNTLVIFTSDNGPWLSKKDHAGTAAPLRGGKFGPYEGGSRVPCIVWQPGTVPAGVVSSEQVSTLDFFPTFASMAGARIPEDRPLDGVDVGPLLRGESETVPEREWFLYRGNAIRVGNWKYVKTKDAEELFDLATDVEEQKNLAPQYPEKVSQLSKRLAAAQASLADPQ
ncbi:sulfatase [Pelagicoccus sp. SDUM812005]|uniref:sulfatase family protein n=1 Tax=Pelagicoccus sp. SDUM812005 TaxID=3041257 RepID=UPI0028105ABB|nr:sulfatase [Pelagicoccus sp. SDUM812005]MDQ8180262.1 sulfatase [Pelagicoccus sp. SDUM812005]